MTKFSGLFYKHLRAKCFVIGYLNLVSGVTNLVCHVVIVAIVSNGFQCDIDRDSLQSVNWPWLEPMLLFVNLGTHGFYPLPLILRTNNIHVKYLPLPLEPKCYPGMVHLYIIDVLNFFNNIIWLKFSISYVSAVHKRNPEPMSMYFALSVVKLVLQIMYFSYQPDIQENFFSTIPILSFWVFCFADLCIAISFLLLIHRYMKTTITDQFIRRVELPPSYIECLMMANKNATQAQQTKANKGPDMHDVNGNREEVSEIVQN